MASLAGLVAAKQREVSKLARQEAAIEATVALIEVLEAQIEALSKKK